jgi:prevent-host-death family protein
MYMYLYTQHMGKTYSVADARAHLPDILNEVEAGKDVHLTRRGRPVAVVLSPERYEALRRERTTFADAYRAFAERYAPDDIALEPDFFDSRRDRAPGRRVRL